MSSDQLASTQKVLWSQVCQRYIIQTLHHPHINSILHIAVANGKPTSAMLCGNVWHVMYTVMCTALKSAYRMQQVLAIRHHVDRSNSLTEISKSYLNWKLYLQWYSFYHTKQFLLTKVLYLLNIIYYWNILLPEAEALYIS